MGLLSKLLSKKESEQKAIDAYNEALAAKYRGEWSASLEGNEIANRLRPGDEATLWNLGIAATALREWDKARYAWKAAGLDVNEGPGEVLWGACSSCVRLDPDGAAETVWGTRIDPVRTRVRNVPLPVSERRYGDIILHDGAQEGIRTSGGTEFPVFNELAVWRMSAHSTFEVMLQIPNTTAMESLEAKCEANDMWVEDWGTVRILCRQCSLGNPAEHVCTEEPPQQGRYGFAARSETALRQLLNEWVSLEDGGAVESVRLAVSGRTD